MRLNRALYSSFQRAGGFSFAKYLSRNHPKVLMFHRISVNGENGSVPVDIFRKQVRAIKDGFNAVTVNELVKLSDKNLIKNSIAITFDDGYSDFMEYAFPILQEEGVSATLFITTGFVNGDLWLWPDQIRYALSRRDGKTVSVDGLPEVFTINDSLDYCWNNVADYCLTLDSVGRNRLIKDLYGSLDLDMPKLAPKEYMAVSWSDLKQMHSLGLELGSHSYSHPILSNLTVKEIKFELEESKRMIAKNLSIDVDGFCYPNGMPNDFNRAAKDALYELGYKCAVTAFPSKKPLADLYQIGRYNGGSSLDEFYKTIYGLKYLSMFLR